MTDITASTPRVYHTPGINDLPVAASTHLYEGQAIGDNGSGYARALVAGDPFGGFCDEDVDNSSGAAGDKSVRVVPEGLVELSISALAITDKGKDVYASADGTFTLTQSTNTWVGTVHKWLATGSGVIKFKSNQGATTSLATSVGTPNDTIPDAGASYSQATMNNIIVTLAGKINALLARQGR